MSKIVVGISGGVDSSVAALLLKQQGHDVHGLFMVNWHDRTGTITSSCTWEDDWDLAQLVAKKIDIPISLVDLSESYRTRVVDYLFDEYAKGRTPNPDVLCNREIKFDVFLNEALKKGADFVATGHYCQRGVDKNGFYKLLAGADPNKDQSYFLCQLNQYQLSKALFPIGDLLKPEVRKIALDNNLPTAQRKDSQGICFVGKVDLPVFLQQKLASKKGDIIEIESRYFENIIENTDLKSQSKPYRFSPKDGKKVGEHGGAHFYTIGQRKGLNVGGKLLPLFVVGTDVEQNVVYVGQGHEFKGMMRKALFIDISEIHWVRPDFELRIGEERRFLVRIRYRQPLQKAILIRNEEGLYIVFDEYQRAITPGQFAAWYLNEELIGSGVIFE